MSEPTFERDVPIGTLIVGTQQVEAVRLLAELAQS